MIAGLQCDIERLERILDKLDQWDKSYGDPKKLRCKRQDDREDRPDKAPGNFQKCYDETRPQVLAEIKQKLMEHGIARSSFGNSVADKSPDEVLIKTREIVSMQRPSRKDYESVRDWLIDTTPLVLQEQEFIQRKEDIITLRTGRESAGFESFVELALYESDKFLTARLGCNIIRVSIDYVALVPC